MQIIIRYKYFLSFFLIITANNKNAYCKEKREKKYLKNIHEFVKTQKMVNNKQGHYEDNKKILQEIDTKTCLKKINMS